MAPFFTAYLQAAGVPHKNITYSDFTSEALYRDGAKRGSIDPCFPSKVAIARPLTSATAQQETNRA